MDCILKELRMNGFYVPLDKKIYDEKTIDMWLV
ncbi:hypothetical protein DOK79_002749 [Enterococcus sp. DIV1094]|uniref:Uncharacterized protein n=1 Tax=Candidatus Enterococcus mangumiae TaxID=2230878 RepID=A0ABZ2SZK7_9ENTE